MKQERKKLLHHNDFAKAMNYVLKITNPADLLPWNWCHARIGRGA